MNKDISKTQKCYHFQQARNGSDVNKGYVCKSPMSARVCAHTGPASSSATEEKKHWKRPPRASCARALQCATGGHARTRRSSQCEVKALNARGVGQFH